MNNSQFRRLLDESSPQSSLTDSATRSSGLRKNASATPLLGSRARSSIPMTPRTVAGHSSSNDFARQVAEHKRATLPHTKKFRSSAAPKGTKLGAGYQDRAALHRQQEAQSENANRSQDDKVERIKALEDMVKLQQIDQATFEKLRDEIGVGGDLGSTHLVKGLDRRLLERVKRGEDVTTREEVPTTEKIESEKRAENGSHEVDEELENVLEKEIQAARREETVKKGEMAPPSSSPLPGENLSRDEILKRLKASRAAALREVSEAKSAEPSLGSRFRKLGGENQTERKKIVEVVNGRRREVLVVTKAGGPAKRKVRWLDKEDFKLEAHGASGVGEALGMEVPVELAAKQKAMLEKKKLEEEEDDDIFGGVGADYNPLGANADESDDDSHSETAGEAATRQEETRAKTAQIGDKPRNYFAATTLDEESTTQTAAVADPGVMAALKRAAFIRRAPADVGAGEESRETDPGPHGKDFLERLRKRESEDAADLDLGFGESRFGDEDDEEGPIWYGEEEGGRKHERKRGAKKRKGNKDEV